MKQFFSKLNHKSVMMLCIAACVLPFAIFAFSSSQIRLSWIGLLLCLGVHLVMMKMLGHSCHSHDEKKPDNQMLY